MSKKIWPVWYNQIRLLAQKLINITSIFQWIRVHKYCHPLHDPGVKNKTHHWLEQGGHGLPLTKNIFQKTKSEHFSSRITSTHRVGKCWLSTGSQPPAIVLGDVQASQHQSSRGRDIPFMCWYFLMLRAFKRWLHAQEHIYSNFVYHVHQKYMYHLIVPSPRILSVAHKMTKYMHSYQ